jgi:hypothetical protein
LEVEKRPSFGPLLGFMVMANIASKLYKKSKRKACTAKKALGNNFWINEIDISHGLDMENIQHFVTLWKLLSDVHLMQDVQDTITWKFTKDEQYCASSTYIMEFKGLTSTTLNTLVWKVWAPPKGKFFARLVMQDNISTADCVARRGWLNWEIFLFVTKS